MTRVDTFVQDLRDLGATMRLHSYTNAQSYAVASRYLFQEFAGLDASFNIWRGYQAPRPFDIPDDARQTWRITFDYTPAVFEVKENATHAFVLAFRTMELGEDGNPHPARAFRLRIHYWHDKIKRVMDYLRISEYPAWVGDRLLHRSLISPINGAYVNLRCIPSELNNVPIIQRHGAFEGWISRALYPMVNPTWAQLKQGGAWYWINLKQVKLGQG